MVKLTNVKIPDEVYTRLTKFERGLEIAHKERQVTHIEETLYTVHSQSGDGEYAVSLQQDTFLLDITKESVVPIVPQSFIDQKLRKGLVLISKDSNIDYIRIVNIMWYKQKNQKDEAFPTKDIETKLVQ